MTAKKSQHYSNKKYKISIKKDSKAYITSYYKRDDFINTLKETGISSDVMEKALKDIRAISSNEPNLLHKIASKIKSTYFKFTRFPLFTKIIITFFITSSVISFLGSVYNLSYAQTFTEWGELIFSGVSGLIVLLGSQVMLFYKKSRRVAYEMFKFSVLISIFLTQFFRFLENQLSAVGILALNLIVFSVLQYLIYEEKLSSEEN